MRTKQTDGAKGIIGLLEQEKNRLTKELRGITAALTAFASAYGKVGGRKQLSAEARERMADAQRSRWAKSRGKSKVVPIRAKRKLSAETRRKISAAQKARWARAKPAKKTA